MRTQAHAVLRVLGGCGLSVSELAAAELRGLVPARPSAAARAELPGRDVDGWSLHVRGKGGRRRTVPVAASVRKAVLALCRLIEAPAPMLVPALTLHRPARLADPPRALATVLDRAGAGRLPTQLSTSGVGYDPREAAATETSTATADLQGQIDDLEQTVAELAARLDAYDSTP